MCSVLKLFSLEVDPTFLAFRTELHAALLAAVELEAALGPCDVTAVAREVVVVQCCDTDGVPVVLEAPNDVVAWVGARLVVARFVLGRPHVLGRHVLGRLVLVSLGVATLADTVRRL